MDRRKEDVKKFFSKIQVPHLARRTNQANEQASEIPQLQESITARPSPAPLPRGLSRSNQTLALSTASLPAGTGTRNSLAPEGPELIVTASSDVSPPKPPRKISKPSITLKIPNPSTLPPQFPPSYRSYAPGAGMINIPLTPGTTIPASTFYEAYPNKASEFMFKQFAGFKDFTMNTAKSGLSFGEQFAFWALNKIKSWSTQWFTHVFLVLVLIAYSLLGGFIFSYTEGGEESKNLDRAVEKVKAMTKERDLVIKRMKDAFLRGDNNNYTITLYNELTAFESKAVEFAALPKKKRWTFWGSVFYSGTVYTTIGKKLSHNVSLPCTRKE